MRAPVLLPRLPPLFVGTVGVGASCVEGGLTALEADYALAPQKLAFDDTTVTLSRSLDVIVTSTGTGANGSSAFIVARDDDITVQGPPCP